MRFGFWATIILNLTIASSSFAEVLFVEGFDYDASLNGQSLHGNTGWDGTRYGSGSQPHTQWAFETEDLDGGRAIVSGVGNGKRKVGWELAVDSTASSYGEYWIRGSFQSADSNLRMRLELLFNDKDNLPTAGDDTSARMGFYGRNLSAATEGDDSRGRSGKNTVRGARFSTGTTYDFLGKVTADRTAGAADTFEVWINPTGFDPTDESTLARSNPSNGFDPDIYNGYFLLDDRDFVQEDFVLNEIRLSSRSVGNSTPATIDGLVVGDSLPETEFAGTVPEPSVLALLLMGGGGVLFRRHRRKRTIA